MPAPLDPQGLVASLAAAFPGVDVRAVFDGGAAGSWDFVLAGAQVAVVVAAVAAALAWRRGCLRTGKGRAAAAFLLAAEAAALWWAFAGVPDDALARHFVVAHEGNTGRTLQLLYHYFHDEPLRSALVRVAADLGAGGSPPVLVEARLSMAMSGTALVAIAGVALIADAGVFTSLVAAAVTGASGAFWSFVRSDGVAGAAGVWAAAMLACLAVLADVGASRRAVLLAVGGFVGSQAAMADLRPELLVIPFPADLLLLWAAATRRPLGDVVARVGRVATRAWRRVTADRLGMAVGVVVLVAVVALPWAMVRAPFWLFGWPRVSQQFPFLLSTAAWLLFVPGLYDLAAWTNAGMAVLATGGLGWALAAPGRLPGVGMGLAALLAANWYHGQSHTQWEFVRWTSCLVPVLAVAGVFAASRLGRRTRILAAVAVACLAGASLTAWTDRITMPGTAAVRENALEYTDNDVEARSVAAWLRDHAAGCVVAPVLPTENTYGETITPDRQSVDLLVLAASRAALVRTGIGPGRDADLAAAVAKAGGACGGAVAYLGLDCSLEGVSFCGPLRARLRPIASVDVRGRQYTLPTAYGRRAPDRPIGFFAIGADAGR